MKITSVLVYVGSDESSESRLRLACNVAHRFDAAVVGMSVIEVPEDVGHPAQAALTAGRQRILADVMAKLADRERWFRDIARGPQALEWRQGTDLPVRSLAMAARCTDLVVIGQMTKNANPFTEVDPGETILALGRPALLVPNGITSLTAESIVIGWKDTREARMAVRDALPFLRIAKNIVIAQVCDPAEDATAQRSLQDVATYLARHGTAVRTQIAIRRETSDAVHLVRTAIANQADLIVTGAYGHGRLGEWIFGGVTRDLLTTSPVCCLMSH